MSEYEEDFEEYADDFEGEAEVDEAEEASEAPALVLVVPALAVSPPPTTVEPEAPRPKAGRRGAAQPPPSVAMALASDEPASEAVVVGGEGGARAWAEISWADLELGEPFARGTSGEIRAARWRGARVAAKSLFGARSAKSADQVCARCGGVRACVRYALLRARTHARARARTPTLFPAAWLVLWRARVLTSARPACACVRACPRGVGVVAAWVRGVHVRDLDDVCDGAPARAQAARSHPAARPRAMRDGAGRRRRRRRHEEGGRLCCAVPCCVVV
jgi:hypothetical protein